MTGRPSPHAVIEVIEQAAAKINLALHVTGRLADGYHELDSIVTFANLVDDLHLLPAKVDALSVSGPFAGALGTGPNLAETARDALRALAAARGCDAFPVEIRLVKNLPVASGIGGGSADAAAVLRGLARLWEAPADEADLSRIARTIGADVPMCLASRPLSARGTGEIVEPLAPFPSFDMVLVNPNVAVSTPAVFVALACRDNPPTEPPAAWGTARQAVIHLSRLRNDLESPARSIAPVIGTVLREIAATGALLTRMSGSGATCFGIYDGAEAAERAAAAIADRHPEWYARACRTRYGITGRSP